MDVHTWTILARLCACLAILATIGDGFTTVGALNQPGVTEANPIERELMSLFGTKWLIFRFLFTLASIWAALRFNDGTWRATVMLLPSTLFVLYAVWNNWRLWRAA